MSDMKIDYNKLKELIVKKLVEVGLSEKESEIVADVLAFSDARGVRSHGIIRIKHYINRINNGGINLKSNYHIKDISSVSAVMDTEGGMGHYAAYLSMNRCIEKLKTNPIYTMLIKNSSHSGPMSYYINMALKEKLIALVFTNADKCVNPYGAGEAYFGTNPIAAGFPGYKHNILIDMATSAVALGRIFRAKEDDEVIPLNWGVDKNGVNTGNPNEVAALSPLGGYKGTALATMVECLTGIFSGAFTNGLVSMYKDIKTKRNLSMFLMVMKPEIFAVSSIEYHKNIDKMFEEIKSLKPAPDFESVKVTGEQGTEQYNNSLKYGVIINKNLYDFLTS